MKYQLGWDKAMVDFSKGLVPVIVQDYNTHQVLMLGYTNEEAYSKTLETNCVYFYSRSREKKKKKGETSGNILKVKELYLDCDSDTVLIKALPEGPTCHTGETSCFFNQIV